MNLFKFVSVLSVTDHGIIFLNCLLKSGYGRDSVVRCHDLSKLQSYKPTGYHREERLAAAIARSKEARQDSYLRNREEFVASAITSAFGGAPVTNERDRTAMGGGYPRVQVRDTPGP